MYKTRHETKHQLLFTKLFHCSQSVAGVSSLPDSDAAYVIQYSWLQCTTSGSRASRNNSIWQMDRGLSSVSSELYKASGIQHFYPIILLFLTCYVFTITIGDRGWRIGTVRGIEIHIILCSCFLPCAEWLMTEFPLYKWAMHLWVPTNIHAGWHPTTYTHFVVVLVYDWLLCLGTEVTLLWNIQNGRILACFVYFLSRYPLAINYCLPLATIVPLSATVSVRASSSILRYA